MSLEKRAKLMQLVGIIVSGYALLWALAPYDAINWPARFILSLSTANLSILAEPLTTHVKWLSAIGAGLLVAVAIFCYGIIAPAILKKDFNTLKFFKIAMITWYLIDSIGSLAAGVWLNILFNTIFLLILLLPVWSIKAEAPKST